jgi:hypothetical protein
MNENLVEREGLNDLGRIVKEADGCGLNLVVIGGYAVRAYTRGYRYTKDIDLVAALTEMGRLIALLKSLGYEVKETKFGLAGSRKLDGGFIDLHISVGEIWDISTNKRYAIDEILKESERMEISGFFEEGRKIKIKAFIAPLEDLVIVKLMTRGREKDMVDLISLITDRWDKLDLQKFSSKCSKADLSRHVREQVLNLIGLIRTGEARKIWPSITGRRLIRKTETDLIRHLREMEKVL